MDLILSGSDELSGQLGIYGIIQVNVSDNLFQVKQINSNKVFVDL
jgi:hypothetical protein